MIFSPTSREYLMQKTVTYIPGSCSFSQMQNIKKKERKREKEGRGGEGIKDCLIFCAIYWLALHSRPLTSCQRL